MSGQYPLSPAIGDTTAFQVTVPGTQDGAWIENIGGPCPVSVQVSFMYGTGSGGVVALLQSSIDDAYTAYDIAKIDFASVSRTVIFQFSTTTSSLLIEPGVDGIGPDSLPESEGILCPVIGDRLKLKVINSGTYSNTVVVGRICVGIT